MLSANQAWEAAHKQRLLPETDVVLDFWIATDPAYVSSVDGGDNQASISKTDLIVSSPDGSRAGQTLERNLWVLDGSLRQNPYQGYVGNESGPYNVTVTLSQPSAATIPGIEIVWSKFATMGYATDFTITATLDGVTVATKTVTGAKTNRAVIDMEIDTHDKITIDITGWSLPDRRPRMSGLYLGHIMSFNKLDILSYEHEQIGHLNSGEITQNKIRFSLDNFGGKWDMSNPSGATKYLTERLRVDVTYYTRTSETGMSGVPGGTFFLSGWEAPSSGHEATFTARDALGVLVDQVYEYKQTGTLADLAWDIVQNMRAQGFGVKLDSTRMERLAFDPPDPKSTAAEVMQMCANACCNLVFYPRASRWIEIGPDTSQTETFTIPLTLAYSYPDITLGKPLKEVSVSYGEEQRYVLPVAPSGETQTVDNPLVCDEEQAARIAEWVKSTHIARTKVKGSFRADPRLDVYDTVTVEGKYGEIYPVMLTYIKYTYTGSFKAEYEGQVVTNYEEAQLCWDL